MVVRDARIYELCISMYVHARPLTMYNKHATASNVLEFMLYVLSPFTSAAVCDFVSRIFYSSLFVSHGVELYRTFEDHQVEQFEDLLNVVKMKKILILERKR